MAIIPWRPREMWWDPFRDLEAVRSEMNRMFGYPLVRWGDRDAGLLEGAWSPAIDVYDSKDNVMVKADVPGMKKDELDVSIHGDTLIMKGEKKQEKETKDKDFVRIERLHGSFNRTIRLPSEVDATKVKATYENGVLELVLPKREESKPKQIQIELK